MRSRGSPPRVQSQALRRETPAAFITPWIAEFIYSYTVNGEYFSGFHPVRVWTRKRADDLSLGWKGRMLVVRYSPSSHESSALLKSDQPGGQLGN